MPELAPHNPDWAERFRAEADAIRRALGSRLIQIEHVGSTAVPDLAAKPTVDIVAGVESLPLPDDAVAALVALGYEDAAEDSTPGRHRFRHGQSFPRDVILHVVEWGSPEWVGLIRFRDALRADPKLRREYEELKRALLEKRGDWYSGDEKRALIDRSLAASAHTSWNLSGSAAETETIGARLAQALAPGDVVTISGELGSGKTTFVRGACRALGVTAPVTSPTYTIGHRYEGDPDVSHLDLYRFTGVSSAEWGDLEPYFEDAIVFVEWPEAGRGGLPPVRASVRLEHSGGDVRRVVIEGDVTLR